MNNGIYSLNKGVKCFAIMAFLISPALSMDKLEENKEQKTSQFTTQDIEMSSLDNLNESEETQEDFQKEYKHTLKILDQNKEQIKRANKKADFVLGIKKPRLGGYHQK